MATTVQLSYLTCTAAQAQSFNELNPHGILSLNQLLETRATSHPNVCVAGFPEYVPDEHRWQLLSFTFSSLLSSSDSLATFYGESTTLKPRVRGDKSDRIVALLSSSCADLLVTLFAAIRLGYGVLLLAPQNTSKAVSHLCHTTKATHLIYHPSLLRQSEMVVQGATGVTVVQMASRAAWETPSSLPRHALDPEDEKNLTALVMHTSGSTGTPKPIYHPHRIWTEAIPCIPGKHAFTTTPLFHGGSADLLRSMNAVSTLYLFPSTCPMSVKNITEAMSICPDTKAFLSVPYILKMLAEHPDGLKMLISMNLVSTGGAPLPETLGDEMVRQGVRLVSRLGSSECGFLMSSHRDYEDDKEWSWLRNQGPGLQLLQFEHMGDSEGEAVYELVVDKKWSTRVVSNRPDRSFASGDLYWKHPTIPNAWRYHGRADDIVVLVTGKKVSASPIETALRSYPSISEAIVFGAARPMLGVLVLPAATATTKDVLACVHAINKTNPSYAQILDELVIFLPSNSTTQIPKTSKGSVIRPKALTVFARSIDDAYLRLQNDVCQSDMPSPPKDQEDVHIYVRSVISKVLRELRGSSRNELCLSEIRDDDDLVDAGIDSVCAVLVRSNLQNLAVSCGKQLSNNVVFEHPSISKLACHVWRIIAGTDELSSAASDMDASQYRLMRELVAKYRVQTGSTGKMSPVKPNVLLQPLEAGTVVLTGVTGSLGAHVLTQILSRTNLRLVALVRARSDTHALERLVHNLQSRELTTNFQSNRARIKVVASELTKERLGLEGAVYEDLIRHTVAVVHIGWPVNFAMSLESFAPALEGTRNLLEFVVHTRRGSRFVFCSSTAAAINVTASAGVVRECLPEHAESATAIGYARAKWVAEHICGSAHETALSGRVVIARVGQLCGDTEHGVWSESEAWPLLIASMRYTECLPVLPREGLSLLPFDIAASALLDVINCDMLPHSPGRGVPVIHVVNPRILSWTQMLGFLESASLHFGRASAPEWISMLEACGSGSQMDPATHGLLDMWKNKFLDVQGETEQPSYDLAYTRQISASVAALERSQVISQELVHKWIDRWRNTGFLR